MTVTAEDFTRMFPEFRDMAYADSIPVWLGVAEQMTNEEAWGSLYTLGVSLFAAHYLVLGLTASKTRESGGVPGQGSVVSSKTVDKVSVSYDTAIASAEGAGNWNLTTYGARRYQLSRLFGAGGVQL